MSSTARPLITILLATITLFIGYSYARTKVAVVPLGGSSIEGYEIVFVTQSINPGLTSPAILQASCPNGKKVMGGGGFANNQDWAIASSFPFNDGSTWSVTWFEKNSPDGGPVPATAYAICVNVN